MSNSAAAGPSDALPPPVNKHAPTAVEIQRQQLAKLLKDPAKPVSIPQPPKEKSLRPPREMMKNVQGSSAGAGSGEFHVYKQNRRREYERLKIMDETSKKELEVREFEERKRQREEEAEAKTAKNRAKRQKKKASRKGKGEASGDAHSGADVGPSSKETTVPKKRLLGGDGKEMTFKRRGNESGDEESGDEGPGARNDNEQEESGLPGPDQAPVAIVEPGKIIIHDD